MTDLLTTATNTNGTALKTHAGRRRSGRSSRYGWDPAWDRLILPDCEVDAAALVDACRKRLSFMLSQTTDRLRAGNLREAKRQQRMIFESASARVAAVYAAVKHKGHKWPARDIVRRGIELDMWHRSNERVLMDLVPNKAGSFRVTYAFGVLEYARQWLANATAKIFAPSSGQLFMHSGGVPAVFRWLEKGVKTTTIAVTTDIPDCFWVMNRNHLEHDGLLPRAVMKSVLFDTMDVGERRKGLEVKGGTLCSPLQQSAYYGTGPYPGRGLPPGAVPASLLTEVRLKSLLDAVENAAEGVLAGAYLDNIIILAPNKQAADASFDALLKAVLSEFGPDAASVVQFRKRLSKAKTGFYYLNDFYRWSKRGLIRRMAEGAYDHFKIKLANEALEKKLSPEAISRKISGWWQQHRYDPRAAAHAAELIALYPPIAGKPDMMTIALAALPKPKAKAKAKAKAKSQLHPVAFKKVKATKLATTATKTKVTGKGKDTKNPPWDP